MRGFRWLFGLFFVLMPLGFMAAGAAMAWRQAVKLTTYRPVDATIVSTRIETHRGKSTTYSPAVEYRYTVDGHLYLSKVVTPLSESSSSGWAQGIISRYPTGQKATAYYDPANPGTAFLVHQYSFFPYMFVLFPMIHLSVGVILVFGASGLRGPAAAAPPMRAPNAGSWFELAPRSSLWQKLRSWMLMTLLWFGVGGAALGHYYLSASPPYEGLAIGATIVYAVLAAIPAVGWIYYLLLMRRTSDAILLVSSDRFATGQTFQARIAHSMNRDTTIESLKIGLVCDRHTRTQSGSKTSYSSYVDFQDYKTLLEHHTARGGELIEQTAELVIPAESVPTKLGDYPQYTWKIAVKAALKDSPDYKAEFPITVEGARSA